MKIGLEVHAGLPTKTKLFCRCTNHSKEPNTAICPTCTGMPGSKPVLNNSALKIAFSISKALNCSSSKTIYFERKVYFYPDLPKSFQITQKECPIGSNGFILLGDKKIRIRRVQLEEDPAKIIREDGYTLIDYNRSGRPLVEIVTEPDIQTEEDLRMFITELKSILYYLDVDVEQEIKADLNISLSEIRVEVKNITGTKNIIDAARYEIQRQEKLINENIPIEKETRSYNEAKMATISSREKESDEEYGFIFDSDLTVYDISKIKAIKPIYASSMAKEYSQKYGVNESQILEAIQFNKNSLGFIERFEKNYKLKNILNSISLLQRYGSKNDVETLEKVIKIIEQGHYPDQKDIQAIESGKEITINIKVANTQEIDKEIRSMIDGNKNLLKESATNKKALNFIIGNIAKKLKVNPRLVSERLESLLSSEHKVQ